LMAQQPPAPPRRGKAAGAKQVLKVIDKLELVQEYVELEEKARLGEGGEEKVPTQLVFLRARAAR